MGEIWDLLPWWVVWGSDLAFVIPCLVSGWLGIWLATKVALAPFRRAHPEHWADRARLLFPAYGASQLAGVLLSGLILVIGLSSVSVSPVPRAWLTASLAACVLTLVVRAHGRVKELGGKPRVGMRSVFASLAVYLIAIYPHFLLAGIATIGVIGPWNAHSAIVLGVLALIAFSMLCDGSVVVLRALGLMRPAPPRVVDAMERVADRAGVPAAVVYELRWDTANAFAFVQARCVAVSSRAAEIFTDAELESVLAHELGHLSESRWVRWQRLLVAMWQWAGIVLIVPAYRVGGLPLMPACLLVLFLAFRWGQSLGHRMEVAADKFAIRGSSDSACYARALEKLYAENLTPAVFFASHGHPDLYDRMVSAGVPPEWPRPEPPSQKRLPAAIVCGIMPALLLIVGGMILHDELMSRLESESAQYAAMVVSFDPGNLGNLARIRMLEGRDDDAVRLLQVATELDRDNFTSPADLVDLLVSQGRCQEAAVAEQQARERYRRVMGSLGIGPGDEAEKSFLESLANSVSSCEERRVQPAEPVDGRPQHRRDRRRRGRPEGPMAGWSAPRSVPG